MKTMENALKQNILKKTDNLIFSLYLLKQVSSNLEINFVDKKEKQAEIEMLKYSYDKAK